MRYETKNKSGAVLLVVLFVVMVITTLSLGFLSRSDVQLAFGRNMVLHSQMDYLAESGLEQAKGLILNPQEVASQYWTGETQQQLSPGSADFYDVTVSKLSQGNYEIVSTAYRDSQGQRIGQSSLQAELRLDPCIAYWQSLREPISEEVTIEGDIYCDDDLAILGSVNGDVYSSGAVAGWPTGQIHENTTPPIALPGLEYSDFDTSYYIGDDQYLVHEIASGRYEGLVLEPSAGNPAGIFYVDGILDLEGVAEISGTLVIKDNLRLYDNAEVVITAVKNFPALIVGHDVTIEKESTSLSITGLAQIGNHIDMRNMLGSSLSVTGALCILGDGIKNTSGCTVNITADHEQAAIEIWYAETDTLQRWGPAADAFYKAIGRN